MLDRAAHAPPGEGRDAAWRELVECYRRPISVCLRRRVRRHPDADAMVTDFFGYLFNGDVLQKLDRRQGRFRAFLQGIMKRYVQGKLREYRLKGDVGELERLLDVELPSGAEIEEERTWARSLLDRAVEQLVRKRRRDGELLLQFYGIHPHTPLDTATLAANHDLSLAAVHKALSRARQELGRLLEAQIAQLVDGDDDYESEKRALIGRLLEAQPGLLG